MTRRRNFYHDSPKGDRNSLKRSGSYAQGDNLPWFGCSTPERTAGHYKLHARAVPRRRDSYRLLQLEDSWPTELVRQLLHPVLSTAPHLQRRPESPKVFAYTKAQHQLAHPRLRTTELRPWHHAGALLPQEPTRALLVLPYPRKGAKRPLQQPRALKARPQEVTLGLTSPGRPV